MKQFIILTLMAILLISPLANAAEQQKKEADETITYVDDYAYDLSVVIVPGEKGINNKSYQNLERQYNYGTGKTARYIDQNSRGYFENKCSDSGCDGRSHLCPIGLETIGSDIISSEGFFICGLSYGTIGTDHKIEGFYNKVDDPGASSNESSNNHSGSLHPGLG